MVEPLSVSEREHRLMKLIDSDCPHDLDEARHLIAQLKTAVRYETREAERRATVERIRERLTLQVVKDASGKWGEVYDAAATDAILDEEAAR